MANKRKPLSFPELEGRGRRAILRSAEEVQAESGMLDDQHASTPANEHSGTPEGQPVSGRASQPPGTPVPQPASRPDAPPAAYRGGYLKATYRLSPEALEAIDETKRVLRRRYGIRVSLEEIAEEAILAAYVDLVENQADSKLASRFSGLAAGQK